MAQQPRLIAVQLPPSAAFLASTERIWDQGDVIMPLSPRLPQTPLQSLLNHFGVSELWDSSGRHVFDSGSTNTLQAGDAAVMLTSGTTGTPKGVIHTHDSIWRAAEITAHATGTSTTSRWICCLPVNHVGGFSVITRARSAGAFIELLESPTKAQLDAARKRGGTHVSLVPALIDRIDPGEWQLVLTGGSQSPRNRPDNVVATYGLTETFGGVVYNGRALPGVELRVVTNHADQPVVAVRTPTLGRSYVLGREVAPLAHDDGWFYTTDLGSLDDDNTLTIHGRVDDVIITGGENVWPDQVEAALEQLPEIQAAAVVGLPHPTWGEQVTAVVVSRPGVENVHLGDIQQQLTNTLARHEIPRAVVIVDDLPRTDIGKLQRSVVKQQLLESHVHDSPEAVKGPKALIQPAE